MNWSCWPVNPVVGCVFYFLFFHIFNRINLLLFYLQVLGLVQNMSYYTCPKCTHKTYIFGKDGAKEISRDMDVDVLGIISS